MMHYKDFTGLRRLDRCLQTSSAAGMYEQNFGTWQCSVDRERTCMIDHVYSRSFSQATQSTWAAIHYEYDLKYVSYVGYLTSP